MSYGELIREIKLEGRLLAITRVHRDEEQLTDTFGCIYKVLKRVLAGETFVFAKDTCSCSGFDHNTGLRDDMPNTPGGFGIFLSQGSDQQWTPPGEKFKCDPQTAEDMFRCLPKEVMGDYDALKFEPYREGMKADVVVAFCNPDQLSALMSPVDGTISGIDNARLDELRAQGNVIGLDYGVGHAVEKMYNGTTRIGHLIVKNDDEAAVNSIMDEIYGAIYVDGRSMRELWAK